MSYLTTTSNFGPSPFISPFANMYQNSHMSHLPRKYGSLVNTHNYLDSYVANDNIQVNCSAK